MDAYSIAVVDSKSHTGGTTAPSASSASLRAQLTAAQNRVELLEADLAAQRTTHGRDVDAMRTCRERHGRCHAQACAARGRTGLLRQRLQDGKAQFKNLSISNLLAAELGRPQAP